MRKRRLAILLSGGFVLGVVACGEVLGADDPLADAGAEDTSTESQTPTNEGGGDTGVEDVAAIDGPTCDVNLLPYDPTNCGACGRTCETACEAGGCAPSSIVTNFAAVAMTNVPVQFLVRDGQLYIADNNSAGAGSGVLRCVEPAATKTCAVARVFTRPDVQEITFIDASVAYAAEYNPMFESFDGGIGTFPIDASGVDAMVKDETIIDARSIALLGGNTVLVATGEGVKRCNVTCKSLVQVAGTSADWVVADANGYCYSGVQNNVRGVYCAPAVGQAADLRAPTTTSPRLALVGDDVIWVDDGKIGARKRAGVSPETFLGLGGVVSAIDPIAADEAFVTWAHQSFLYRCPRSGCAGDPTVLASVVAPQRFSSVALLGKWLYFGEAGPFGSRVLRIPK